MVLVATSSKMEKKSKEMGADFETAVIETKFGFFNLILVAVTIPSLFASVFELSSTSYVYPVAQCDLNLSLQDRGTVNAVIYTGMILSCCIWGSLADVFGRRKVIMITQLIDFCFSIMAAFATSLPIILVAKFFGGFVINGISMVLAPYLSEFHCAKYRSKVPILIGLFYHCGNLTLPLIAWGVLPLTIKFEMFQGYELHSWNLLLFICALPSLFSGIFFALMPESPKYLMSKGKNEEALNVFKKVFRLNTLRNRDEFPYEKLIDDQQIDQKVSFKKAWIQLSPLFSKLHAYKLILVCFLQFFVMMGVNSLRLWLPDIFQIVNDYQADGKADVGFCEILNTINSVEDKDEKNCSVNFDNSSVYINSVIIAFASIVSYIAAAMIVNKLGKKKMMILVGITAATSVLVVYFAPNSITALILFGIYITAGCLCVDLTVGFAVELFPTSLRASALSLSYTFGRLGSVLGNLIFPILLRTGCAFVFFTLGGLAIICIIISIFLPNTDQKALE